MMRTRMGMGIFVVAMLVVGAGISPAQDGTVEPDATGDPSPTAGVQEEQVPSVATPAESATAADDSTSGDNRDQPADAGDPANESDAMENAMDRAGDGAREVVDDVKQNTDKLATSVDADQRAVDAKESLLQPIYSLAEAMNFSAFHWVAFTAMLTGVVSFGLQLVLGKLVALARFSFSMTEILSDALGLLISVVGLVLTTQAATENSKFTESAFAVLSAGLVGIVLGIIFYWWGQKQELQAIDARRLRASASKK